MQMRRLRVLDNPANCHQLLVATVDTRKTIRDKNPGAAPHPNQNIQHPPRVPTSTTKPAARNTTPQQLPTGGSQKVWRMRCRWPATCSGGSNITSVISNKLEHTVTKKHPSANHSSRTTCL
eukprot:505017-Prorocentrum_minimum.AAC.2